MKSTTHFAIANDSTPQIGEARNVVHLSHMAFNSRGCLLMFVRFEHLRVFRQSFRSRLNLTFIYSIIVRVYILLSTHPVHFHLAYGWGTSTRFMDRMIGCSAQLSRTYSWAVRIKGLGRHEGKSPEIMRTACRECFLEAVTRAVRHKEMDMVGGYIKLYTNQVDSAACLFRFSNQGKEKQVGCVNVSQRKAASGSRSAQRQGAIYCPVAVRHLPVLLVHPSHQLLAEGFFPSGVPRNLFCGSPSTNGVSGVHVGRELLNRREQPQLYKTSGTGGFSYD